MGHWDGSAWQYVQPTSSTTFTWITDPMWTVNKTDLGGATSFATYVTAGTYDPNLKSTVARDIAPDDGRWLFDLAGPRTKLVSFVVPTIAKPVAVPATVAAGRRVSLSFRVTTDADGKVGPLTKGKLVGSLSIDGKALRGSQSFSSGVARLSFAVPQSASGKQLKARVTIKASSHRGPDGLKFDLGTGDMSVVGTYYVGQSASRTATFRIR